MRDGRLCKACERVLLERGMVKHIPRLAIAVGSYGVVLLAVSLLYCGFLGLIGIGMTEPGYSPADDDFLGIGVFVVLALPQLPASLLHIAAGAALRRHRGRLLAYVAIGSGLLSIGAACLFPVSVGLLIYAGLVLGDVDVRAAFDAEEQRDAAL
jgi:hypothetical protein